MTFPYPLYRHYKKEAFAAEGFFLHPVPFIRCQGALRLPPLQAGDKRP